MQTKTARIRTMMTAATSLSHARTQALDLVRSAERTTGSRMLAYEAVARNVGVSPSWLRKLIGCQPVQLLSHIHDNIRSAHAEYSERCAMLEARADEKRALFFALQGSRNASHPSMADGQGVGSRHPSAQPRSAPSMVASLVAEGRK